LKGEEVSIFTTSLEPTLSKIPEKIQCPPRQTRRAGKPVGSRAKSEGVKGRKLFAPSLKIWGRIFGM